MDLLNDLFREAGLRRRLLDVHGVPPDRALRFPCERSLGFHVVLAGTLYLHPAVGAAPLRLEAGDVAVMGRGTDHRLAARARLGALPEVGMSLTGAGRPAAAGDVVVVSGAYQLWHAPVHPLFAELPPWFVRRAERARPLDPISLTVSRICACPESPDVAESCSKVCSGTVPTFIFYKMSAAKEFSGILMRGLPLQADAQVQVR